MHNAHAIKSAEAPGSVHHRMPLLRIMPRYPGRSPICSNLMRRIKRCMSECGVEMTDARLTFACLFCAVCAMRNELQRSRVANAMIHIIRDHQELEVHEVHTQKLASEIMKLREELLSRATAVRVNNAVRALPHHDCHINAQPEQ